MRSIAENPGIEQVALTEVAVSTKATLAEMLSRMEARGLVRREHDPADKRRRFVFLTAEGEALLESSKPIGNEVDEAFLGALTARNESNFQRSLKNDAGLSHPDAHKINKCSHFRGHMPGIGINGIDALLSKRVCR